MVVLILLIGLTGTIGSGKSTVAKLLSKMGAKVVDLDKIGHKILNKKSVKDRLLEAFGREITNPDGSINRRKLAEKAFKSNDSVEMLNSITHPEIKKELSNIIRKEKERGTKCLVVESPLLLETKTENLFDIIIMITTEKNLRIKRVKSRGWSEEELRRRERFFTDEKERLKIADIVLQNNGSLKELEKKVEDIWNSTISQKISYQTIR